MSQRQAEYKTTAAFPEPNYTQTPNDFFEMLPDMYDSEIRVTLVMIRNTFGFHRDGFKMGLNKLAGAAGLSRNAAKDGAEAAERRGTFRRTNPDALGEAEWSLVVDPSTSDQGIGQPVTTPPSTSDQQVRVKETIKKVKVLNKKEGASASLKAKDFPGVILVRSVMGRYPARDTFQIVDSAVKKVKARLGRDVVCEDLRPFWEAWRTNGFKSINLSWLTDWAVAGKITQNGNGAKHANTQASNVPTYTEDDRAIADEIRKARAMSRV